MVLRTKVGLVGTTHGYGLAHTNHDLAVQLGACRWLTADDPSKCRSSTCVIECRSPSASDAELSHWLTGLDVVLFVERPSFPRLPLLARALGVHVICIPMWEWLHPCLDWLPSVDMMLCPTRHTASILHNWKTRFDFDWTVACVPWPVPSDRFEFRLRKVCKRFVYVLGSGGALAIGNESNIAFRRKGLDVLLAAVERAPEISLIVFAYPQQLPPRLPANIEVRLPPADNRRLYDDGDVCVQPSLWEGLGLPLLECQAAGLPLITTDAPPMNEHQPMLGIPAQLECARLTSEIDIPAARILPNDLAVVLRSVHGKKISTHSRNARRFVERQHSWRFARPEIQNLIAHSLEARALRRTARVSRLVDAT